MGKKDDSHHTLPLYLPCFLKIYDLQQKCLDFYNVGKGNLYGIFVRDVEFFLLGCF